MAELLDAGTALRQAQQDALAGQPNAAWRLRTGSAQLRAAITRLLGRAETLLVRAGHAASDALCPGWPPLCRPLPPPTNPPGLPWPPGG